MALPQTFRRRKALAAGPQSDVYEYGDFPLKLRVQLERILERAIGTWSYSDYGDRPQNTVWTNVCEMMRQEEGVRALNDTYEDLTPQEDLLKWMSSTRDGDAYLEALERLMLLIDKFVKTREHQFARIQTIKPDDSLAEINARIRESGYGYEYKNGEIIRIDSLFIHVNAVLPAINLTNNTAFKSSNAEYMKAHEAFRNGDYETSLTECGKAFESVLKIIAAKRGWTVKPTDPASKLIEAAVSAKFLEPYMTAGFTALRSMLDSGVPTIRNKSAAHGAGVQPRIVPQELAAFQLHQTASVIVFLIESDQAKP